MNNFMKGSGTLHEAFALELSTTEVGRACESLSQKHGDPRFPGIRTESISHMTLDTDIQHRDVRTLYKGSIPFVRLMGAKQDGTTYIVLRIHFLDGNYFDVVKVMRDARLWSNSYVNLQHVGKHANLGKLYDDLNELGIYEVVKNAVKSKITLPWEPNWFKQKKGTPKLGAPFCIILIL